MPDAPSGRPAPRVFPSGEIVAGANHALARSARILTPETGGSTRLFAGMFWSDPGAVGGWAFVPDDPQAGRVVDGLPRLGDHDEVYLCLAGRMRLEWDEGTIEFAAGDVVHLPTGWTYRSSVVGEEQVRVFYVMTPPPDWMPPLET